MCNCVFCGEPTRGTSGKPGGDPALCVRCLAEQRSEIIGALLADGAVQWGDLLLDLAGADLAEEPELPAF